MNARDRGISPTRWDTVSHETSSLVEEIDTTMEILQSAINGELDHSAEVEAKTRCLEKYTAELEFTAKEIEWELTDCKREMDKLSEEQTKLLEHEYIIQEQVRVLESNSLKNSTPALIHELDKSERTLRAVEDRYIVLEGQSDSTWMVDAALSTAKALAVTHKGTLRREPEVGSYRTDYNGRGVSSALEYFYDRKQGDILDELVANLVSKQEPNTEAHKKEVLVRLCYAASSIKKRLQNAPTNQTRGLENQNLVELLVLWLYTSHGVDIDAAMGFDVPKHEEVSTWNDYINHYNTEDQDSSKRLRNGNVFGDVNWAMRTVLPDSLTPTDLLGKSEQKKAKDIIFKWCKFIAVLSHSTSIKTDQSKAPTLYRGFGGQGDTAYEAMTTRTNRDLHWPAFSSCALDRSVSLSYVDGTAQNATAKTGGVVIFEITKSSFGYPLWFISQYPDERELLLPPMTYFKVISSVDSEDIKNRCLSNLKGSNITRDSVKASIVQLEVKGTLCLSDMKESLRKWKLDCEKSNRMLSDILAEVDLIALPSVVAQLREQRQSLEAELRELARTRDIIKGFVTGEVSQAADRDKIVSSFVSEKGILENKLQELQDGLLSDELSLLNTDVRLKQYGPTFESAMLFLKATVINLVTDYAYIGQIHSTIGRSGAWDGLEASFAFIRQTIEQSHGEQRQSGRWILRSSSSTTSYPLTSVSSDLFSALKQMVVCYDLLPYDEQDAHPAAKEIMLNIDILCDIANEAKRQTENARMI